MKCHLNHKDLLFDTIIISEMMCLIRFMKTTFYSSRYKFYLEFKHHMNGIPEAITPNSESFTNLLNDNFLIKSNEIHFNLSN